MVVLALSVIAAIWAVAMMTAPGRIGYVYFFTYAEYYMGVISLVSLSITIMVGLVATDRLVLSIRQRVLLQSAHRTTGVIAVASLVTHVWMKIVEKHISAIDAFIPFLVPGYNKVFVGLGTISGWIMILVMWTGLARSRFIGRGKPWLWRSLHAVSYLMWPIALTHGLFAGRPAATWVTVSYVVCVLGVLVGLAVRLSVSLNRRKDFSSTASAGGMKPVGSLVPTTSPAMKRPGRREKPAPVEPQTLGPVAVVDTFRPAEVTAPPLAPPFEEDLVAPRQRRARAEETYDEPTGAMQRFEEDEPRRGRRYEDEIEYDEPRGRRYPGEDTSIRMRRPELEDTSTRMRRSELEDTSTRMRRSELEDTSTRMGRRSELEDTSTRMRRRSEVEDTSTRMRRPELEDTNTRMRYDDEPAPRGRRYADDDEPAPRSRRRGDMPLSDDSRGADSRGGYDDVPRQRGSRYADDEPPARRSRYDDEIAEAPRSRRDDSGRHSRSGFVEMGDGGPYIEPDETPTLVDMASRRARRDQQDPAPSGRRGGRGRDDEEAADDGYWSQLRGEAN
ncbi:translation initiation factor III [Actinoplanes solisilvae]|uniref:translation initiation factor III n=1 Tax=Actinoplanes solisilvae TaxID=2486853 RepID=UPI001F0C9A68|nr:translation initiation factor III [Actinoplanes solisilvae]